MVLALSESTINCVKNQSAAITNVAILAEYLAQALGEVEAELKLQKGK